LLAKRSSPTATAPGTPISLHEFLYPLLQGYDRVGGALRTWSWRNDQKFNVAMGPRSATRHFGQRPSSGRCCRSCRGFDGVQKMSKSLGNTVGPVETRSRCIRSWRKLPDAVVDEYLHPAFTGLNLTEAADRRTEPPEGDGPWRESPPAAMARLRRCAAQADCAALVAAGQWQAAGALGSAGTAEGGPCRRFPGGGGVSPLRPLPCCGEGLGFAPAAARAGGRIQGGAVYGSMKRTNSCAPAPGLTRSPPNWSAKVLSSSQENSSLRRLIALPDGLDLSEQRSVNPL